MGKETKECLIDIDAIKLYKEILENDSVYRFPRGFWKRPDAKKDALKQIKYLIEEVLQYDDETLKAKLSQSMFRENKLSSMLEHCFNNSPYKAINAVYPNKFKEWEFKSVSKGYWENRENAINAIKWLIEEKLNLTDEEVKKKVSYKFFLDNGLGGMFQSCFNNSPYEAMNAAYPNKYKEWEFRNVSRGYWQDRTNAIKATKWLIEEKLNFSDEELKKNLSFNLFAENGLRGMLVICYNYNVYEAINEAYPNRYKKNDFEFFKNNFR